MYKMLIIWKNNWTPQASQKVHWLQILKKKWKRGALLFKMKFVRQEILEKMN